MKRFRLGALAAALLFAGCTTIPTGPSTMALPGTGKPFDQFRFDDGACRQYAFDAIGGQTAARAQEQSGVTSAVAGAAIGALIGGAVGGGHGAAVGAGVGAGAGGIAGVSAAESSGYHSQQRYDNAYTQCMYGKGHRVAVSGRFAPSAASAPSYGAQGYPYSRPAPAYYPPPAPSYRSSAPPPSAAYGVPPPPPPGSPPPNPAWIR